MDPRLGISRSQLTARVESSLSVELASDHTRRLFAPHLPLTPSVDIRDYKDYETPDSRRGQLTRIGAIDYGDSDSWLSKLRRQIRNPSLLTFFIMAIVILAIPIAIVAPGFYSGAREGIVRIRQDTVVQFLEVATPSHVYPYLQRNVQLMKDADTQSKWRRISFKLGPCNEANLAQFPEGKYTAGIAQACNDLHNIQLEFADDCLSETDCNIPTAAIVRLNAVSVYLQETFSDAYSSRHTESLGTGE